MLYSIGDVKDWQALKQGQFVNHQHQFNLEKALDEVKNIVNFHLKSHNKSIKLIFDPNFYNDCPKNEEFVSLVQMEQITTLLDEID